MTKESGSSARTFKNALIWAVADDTNQLKDDTKKVLAWEEIKGEKDDLGLDDTQKKQLDEHVGKAARDVKESVWRTYKKVAVLNKDNSIRVIDLGLVHSSSADSMTRLILDRLRNEGDITDDVSPNFLIRNWPPAFKEWSTRSVQNVFYASPLFPRLTHPERVKDAIIRGVTNGVLAYVGKAATSMIRSCTKHPSVPLKSKFLMTFSLSPLRKLKNISLGQENPHAWQLWKSSHIRVSANPMNRLPSV